MKTQVLGLAAMALISMNAFANETWKGSGAAYAPDGKQLETYDVEVVNTDVAPNVVQSNATVTAADGSQKVISVLSKLMESLKSDTGARRIAVRCGSKFIVIDPSKISAILARNHYAAILFDGRELLADDSLDVLETRLNRDQFSRIHRSALINIDYLKELEREGDRKYTAVLSDSAKTRVPVSRERLDELKTRLGIISALAT